MWRSFERGATSLTNGTQLQIGDSSTAAREADLFTLTTAGLLRADLLAHHGGMNTRISPTRPSVESLIAKLGGAVRRKDLVARGITDWAIRKSLAAGTIRQIGRGVFAVPEASTMDELLATHQAALDCYSRAEQLGLWVLHRPVRPHVATAHGREVPGCVVHRAQGRLSFWDFLRHCAQCGTELEALCVFESAVVLKHCTIAQLRRVFIRRKDSRIRRIVDRIDPQSQSIAETCARYHLLEAGHNVQGQAAIRGMGHLDALVDGVLGLEIDGEKYHNDPNAWEEDLRRGNVLTIQGIPTLHFKAAVALYYPEELLQWVRSALNTIASARG